MPRADQGYTVLESLVAFAILSIVLVALFQLGGTSLNGLDRNATMQRVLMLAQSKLDEIAADRSPLPAKTTGGFYGSDVKWTVTASDLPTAQGMLEAERLQAVTITLNWDTGNGDNTFSLQTRHLGVVPR
jgi:type II secretory pathway pseudopilin PulG